MNWTDIIAERRAAEAASHGGLSKLPGEGAPLDLSEDLLVPPEVRALVRTLKHAGFTPPEIAAMKAIARIEKELEALGEVFAKCRQYGLSIKAIVVSKSAAADGLRF